MRSTLLALAAFTILSCGTEQGDPHSDAGVPPVGGKDKRIREVANPTLPGHNELVGTVQSVSGAIVVAVDAFDEAQTGRSAGTIYVQDLGSKEAYSGISLFAPTFNPGNLRVSPGDVLDLRGEYQETKNIGATVKFAPGAPLVQLVQPIATFRYETAIPQPIDIKLEDLADYTKGRQWMSMLVRITDVTLQEDATKAEERDGRLAVDLLPRAPGPNSCEAPFPKVPEMTNDLFDVSALALRKGQKLKSVTGVVGYFCSLKIAPRSAADIVMQ